MVKNLFRILLFILIFIVLLISFLSIFGVKTNKFNEIIKSQITKQDKRIKADFENVYFKINLKERSFSLNIKDVNFFIFDESQQISNIDLLIDIVSIIKKDNKIKKIIINSKQNKINNLLKFVNKYKLNVPALYLENSISKGNIIYNATAIIEENGNHKIDFYGEIIDAKLNILGKKYIEDINFNFYYKNNSIEISQLSFKNKNIIFKSDKILSSINENLIKIEGNFKNKINSVLVADLFKYNIESLVDKNNFLQSHSNFKLSLNKKFKIKDFELKTSIKIDNLNINLKNVDLKDYISDFNRKIILTNGEINLRVNKELTNIDLKSKYAFNEKNNTKNIKLNYDKTNQGENYDLSIDLTEYEINFEDINFQKKKDKKLSLNLSAQNLNNQFLIKDLKLFNNKNKFILKNIKFNESFKIKDFSSIEANYNNYDKFINQVSIKKINNIVKLTSDGFDISSDIEKNLKGKSKGNLFDIFENFNSTIDMNIKLAKIDNDHSLKNLNGKVIIKNNNIDKADFSGKFDKKNKFNYKKDKIDGNKVTIIYSDLAKPFVKKFDFIKGFEDGKLDYTSTEINKDLSKSELRIYDFKLQDMPALTKLLSLASLQGIADLATGEGIRFNEFDMFFDHSEKLITINEIYALGPAISILMEGYVEKNKLVSLRGTLVPATTINKTIAKIPLLGNILVGEKSGEGVFGVSFKIKGPPDNLNTRVNPIKTLTPRFITRTLNKIKKSN